MFKKRLFETSQKENEQQKKRKVISKFDQFYLDYCTHVGHNKKNLVKWNWAAFFFSDLWLIYRGFFVGYIIYRILWFTAVVAVNFITEYYLLMTYSYSLDSRHYDPLLSKIPEHNLYVFLIISLCVKRIFLGFFATALFYKKYQEKIWPGGGVPLPQYPKITLIFIIFLLLFIFVLNIVHSMSGAWDRYINILLGLL